MTPNPQDSAVALEVERAKFEAFVRTQPGGTDHALNRRDMDGSERAGQYVNPTVNFGWKVWQTCASQSDGTSGKEMEALRDQRDALMRALEVIAVGDSPDPVTDAGDELVALGYWRKEGLDSHRALMAAAPNQGENHVG